MKRFITLATAGLLLLSLQGVRAQREVEPPAIPPMLEEQKPLAHPETREPAAAKPTKEKKAKPKAKGKTKAKTGKKASKKKAAVKKGSHKKAPSVAKKKSGKNHTK
jgi:hypothetical protein